MNFQQILNDPDLNNIAAVRNGLKRPDYDVVKMECFNRDEAQTLWNALTAEERKRVVLTWLCFTDACVQPLSEPSEGTPT